jgi:peptidoglycan/xylan/chitin deacetylase (PgdA/CDA1 family)
MYARQVTWPQDARVALSLVVNVEEGSERSIVRGDKGMEAVDELGMFLKDPIRNHANESNYAFGINVGAPRLLAMLARHGMTSTWTVCGQALEAAPALARAITAAGHEACSHGYRWQFQHRMDAEAERAFIIKSADSIEATTGQRPKGWLSRYFSTDNTRRLLAEEGFVYHMDDFSDEAPFWDDEGGRPIVVVPYQLDTNDMKMWPHPGYTARDWLDYVIDSFDLLHAEGGETPRLMSVGVHLRIIGRPGRAAAFERFLQHVESRTGVWVATRLQIAEHFARAQPYGHTAPLEAVRSTT